MIGRASLWRAIQTHALGFVVASLPLAAQPSVADTLALSERRRIVDAMDRAVQEHFGHWAGLRGQSYDSMLAVFRSEAEAARDRLEFDRAALAFAAGLRNGHTAFSDPWLTKTHGQTLWLTLWPAIDGWIVLVSEIDDLRRGDVVTTIDGQSIEQFYQSRRRWIGASNERLRRYALTFEDHLFPQRFTVGLADGRRFEVQRGVPAESVVTARRSRQPLVPHRWIVKDSIAYVRVRRFAPPVYEDSAIAVISNEYENAPVLIVDVRGNSGGSTPSKLIETLMAGMPWRRLQIESSRIAADRLAFLAGLRRVRGGKPFRGALYILTDGVCGSACDDFVAPFEDNKRAVVIGDTTAGTSGQPKTIDLGNGMSFRVSQRRYLLADGRSFEGTGVPPHIFVPLDGRALREGRDDVLERTLLEARAGRTGKRPP